MVHISRELVKIMNQKAGMRQTIDFNYISLVVALRKLQLYIFGFD